jgi:hypothetical protein
VFSSSRFYSFVKVVSFDDSIDALFVIFMFRCAFLEHISLNHICVPLSSLSTNDRWTIAANSNDGHRLTVNVIMSVTNDMWSSFAIQIWFTRSCPYVNKCFNRCLFVHFEYSNYLFYCRQLFSCIRTFSVETMSKICSHVR